MENKFRYYLHLTVIFTIFFFLNLQITDAIGGAWAQRKNGYYLKMAGNYLYTNQEFNHLGDKVDILEDFVVYENTAFQDFSIQFYFEYGLVDWFTLISDISYKNLTTKRTVRGVAYFDSRDISITTSGFSDLWLSGRLPLIQSPVMVSLQSGVKFPLGYSTEPENDGATLGTGEIDGELALKLGRSFWPKPLYFTGGVGYRFRGGPNHDEVLFKAEFGYTLQKFNIKLTIDGVRNTSTPPDIYGQTVIAPLTGGGGALPDILYGDQDYLKFLPAVMYKFRENWGINFELIHTAAGRNIITGTTYSLGIVIIR
jgi:hypothetical protein